MSSLYIKGKSLLNRLPRKLALWNDNVIYMTCMICMDNTMSAMQRIQCLTLQTNVPICWDTITKPSEKLSWFSHCNINTSSESVPSVARLTDTILLSSNNITHLNCSKLKYKKHWQCVIHVVFSKKETIWKCF